MTDADEQVACERHGKCQTAFVCQHLFSGSGLGFNWAEDPENPDGQCPDAWCDACEVVLQEEGEWTERAMALADIKVVCALCYENLRERNWVQNGDEFERLLGEALPFLEERQSRLREEFHIGSWERYDWYQETGQLVFSHGGRARVIADIVFVGSLSTKSNTWLWSWANRSVLEPVKSNMRAVREYGVKHRLLKVAGALWSATEEDGWEMTAIAALLLNAVGAYRTPSDSSFTYMVMTGVKWAQ
jgi:hypothetical protein